MFLDRMTAQNNVVVEDPGQSVIRPVGSSDVDSSLSPIHHLNRPVGVDHTGASQSSVSDSSSSLPALMTESGSVIVVCVVGPCFE